jgi:pimeloyl-ACP methyl ester carboxylesterase
MEETTLKARTGRTQPAVWHEPGASVRGAAVVLPGVAYTPARPLLHFTTKVLQTSGFGVVEVWYDYADLDLSAGDDGEVGEALAADAEAALAEADARAGGPERLVVGKSLGTRHLAALARAGRLDGVPSAWLTPLLARDPVMDALLRRTDPTLVVAGGEDPASPGWALEELGGNADPATHLVRVAGAGHALERSAPRDAVDALGEVVDALASFVVGLSRG